MLADIQLLLASRGANPVSVSPRNRRRRVDRDRLGVGVGLAGEDGRERDGVRTTVARRVLRAGDVAQRQVVRAAGLGDRRHDVVTQPVGLARRVGGDELHEAVLRVDRVGHVALARRRDSVAVGRREAPVDRLTGGGHRLVQVVGLVEAQRHGRLGRRVAAAVAAHVERQLGRGNRADPTIGVTVDGQRDLSGTQYRGAGALGEGDASLGVAVGGCPGLDLEVRAVGARDAELDVGVHPGLGLGDATLLDVRLVPNLNHAGVHDVNVTAHAVAAQLDDRNALAAELHVADDFVASLEVLRRDQVEQVLVELQAGVPLQDRRALGNLPLEATDDVPVLAGVADDRADLGDDDGRAAGLLGDRLGLLRALGVLHLDVRSLLDGLGARLDVVVRCPPRQLGRAVHRHPGLVVDRELGGVVVVGGGHHGEVEVAVAVCVGGGCRHAENAENDAQDGQHEAEPLDVLHGVLPDGKVAFRHDVSWRVATASRLLRQDTTFTAVEAIDQREGHAL